MIEYKLIREISENPSHTQRTLADRLNVSLGKVNYVLAGFIEKGMIKAKKIKNHPDKIRWQYNLTPKGVKEKIRITREYFRNLMQEFDEIQIELRQLKKEVETSVSTGK